MNLKELSKKSKDIRQAYHTLEESYHGRKWTLEEDGLAFSTDVGLVNRFIMDRENTWPAEQSASNNLEYKIGETVWWLAVLAERSGIDFEEAIEKFINTKLEDFNI